MPFKAGQGGRPPGATNKATREVKQACAGLGGPDGLVYFKRLHALATGSDVDPHVQIKALVAILAYKVGKPRESVEVAHSGEVWMPTQVIFELHRTE